MGSEITDPPYWVILFEDPDVRPEVLADEAVARAQYAYRLQNWNCHLFKQVSCNGKPLVPAGTEGK